MKVLCLRLVAFIFILLLADAALADNCPYCGREYGAPMPGDEARVYALRREHEQNCPARPRGGDPEYGGATYGVVTIYNNSDSPITYEMKRTSFGQWETVTVQPNASHYHWQTLPAHFEIRYRSRRGAETRTLPYNVVTGRQPTYQDGCAFTFTGDGMSLAGSYGVVTIFNKTNKPITYEIQGRRDASWGKATVEPGGSYYHWYTLPASFQIKFDESDSWGYQAKYYDLPHNEVTTEKPVSSDGRPYEFVQKGNNIDLFTGGSTSLPGFNVSFVGGGSGAADDVFGKATQASGTYYIDYMTQAGHVRHTGTWTARRTEELFGLPFMPKSEKWIFTDDATGSEAHAKITGGAGTAEVWPGRVPDQPDHGEFKIKFGIQFNGQNVTLLTFVKAF
ncbi:MAG: hypothetical protein AB1696_23185 [Planctomycetota bacterium]